MPVINQRSALKYKELPDRARKAIDGFIPDEARIAARIEQFRSVKPRPADKEADVETLDRVNFTHHFVEAPGDDECVSWHYVECGQGEPIVFLHGIPDSWFQWHHQMAALSKTNRCIAIDLKGYGQSETGPGEYRHERVADQLWAMLQEIGLTQFNLVTHDRGTVQADFIAAKYPSAVLRYGRGEQRLYHFNPALGKANSSRTRRGPG